MIVVEGLSKSYGTVKAVDDLSFELATGTFFAFLGKNGAGKSTTIGCMIGNVAYDTGRITVSGHLVGRNDDRIRREIGVVFQESLLDPMLTARENLELRAGMYRLGARGRRNIDDLCQRLDIRTFADRRYGDLSGGEKRRVDIARALVHSPSTLFLDEPTSGLDPQSREQVWSALNGLRGERGLTILLTTHYMHETELADDVLVIDGGRKVAEGAPQELRARHSRSVLVLRLAKGTDRDALVAGLASRGVTASTVADGVHVEVADSNQARDIMDERRDAIEDFELRHGTMDDVFLSLTGSGIDAQ